jgi:hypothetical protein
LIGTTARPPSSIPGSFPPPGMLLTAGRSACPVGQECQVKEEWLVDREPVAGRADAVALAIAELVGGDQVVDPQWLQLEAPVMMPNWRSDRTWWCGRSMWLPGDSTSIRAR